MKRFLLLCLLCFVVKLSAQIDTIPVTGPGGWIIPSVKNILVDNTGNIWFGTTAGLKKYFGSNWTTFNTSNSGLPHQNVSYVVQDNSGLYWIGTAAGLTKFDGSNWTAYTTSNSPLSANPISCLETGNGNDVWIGTSSGLDRFDGTTWTSYNTLNSAINSNNIRCMQFANNQLYVGTDLGFSIVSTSGIQNFPSLGNVLGIVVSGTQVWLKNATGIYRFQNGQYTSVRDLYDICSLVDNYTTLPVTTGIGGGLTYLENGNITNLNNGQLTDISLLPGSPGHITRQGNRYYVLEIIGGVKTLLRIDPAQLNHSSYPIGLNSTPCPQEELNINQVRATMLDRGDMFWDVASNARYEVPKGSGSMATFAGSIWMGGKVNGQLHTACQTYRQTGMDFWPGPLDTLTAHNQQAVSSLGTQVRVNRYDIQNFINNFNSGNVQSGAFVPSKGIRFWPASDTGNFSRLKAPFIDVNNNGVYDPLTGGDYPDIKGDQLLYHVYNDASGQHTETGGNSGAMGLEIRQKSYAYTCPGIADSMRSLNYTTFYEFEIINRSDTLIDSMYIAYWNDTDLGGYNDDYIGCNVGENYGYVYNGDNYDEDFASVAGYHDYTPCFSTAILESPYAIANDGKDNDHDGTTDEPGEQVGMSAYMIIHNNGDAITGNPSQQAHYYNYMQGKWKDGSTLKYGGNGSTGTLATTFQYPGNTDPIGYGPGGNPGSPNPQPAWTEITAGNMPGDRRFIIGSGPFQLAAKDTTRIVYAMVFTQDSTAPGNNIGVVAKNELDVKQIKRWYASNSFPSCLALPVGIKVQTGNELAVSMYPNPANTCITIETEEYNNAFAEITTVLGQSVMIKQLQTRATILGLEQLTAGIYFVTVKNNTGSKTCKLIKE